jgi:hypothetical protein
MLQDLDDSENTDEVWIKDGDREYKVTGKRATSLLDKLLPPDEDTGDDGEDAEADVPAEDVTPDRHSARYFGKKSA